MEMECLKYCKMVSAFYVRLEAHILLVPMIFMFRQAKLDASTSERAIIFPGKLDLQKMENVILHYLKLMKLILKRLIKQKEKSYLKT